MNEKNKRNGKLVQPGSRVNAQQYVPKTAGNSINIKGDVYVKGDIVGGNKTINNSTVINQAFEEIRQVIDELQDQDDKQEAQEIIKKLEMEAQKGEAADEKKVERWFNFLAGMSGDIWDILINTFSNPILGIGTVFQKIAAKAKESSKT